jgi:hypothetical protein
MMQLLLTFFSGMSTFNAAQYSELGLLNLDVQDNSSGNASLLTSATAINIGRFISAYFTQTAADDGLFAATSNSTTTYATYSGHMDELTNRIMIATRMVLMIIVLKQQPPLVFTEETSEQFIGAKYLTIDLTQQLQIEAISD